MFMDEIIQSYFNFKNTIFKDLIAQLIEIIFNIILVFLFRKKDQFQTFNWPINWINFRYVYGKWFWVMLLKSFNSDCGLQYIQGPLTI